MHDTVIVVGGAVFPSLHKTKLLHALYAVSSFAKKSGTKMSSQQQEEWNPALVEQEEEETLQPWTNPTNLMPVGQPKPVTTFEKVRFPAQVPQPPVAQQVLFCAIWKRLFTLQVDNLLYLEEEEVPNRQKGCSA